jgi:hypothetical protein
MRGYEAVDQDFGTVYIPKGTPDPVDPSTKTKYDYTFLRRVLNENEYIHNVGQAITLHDLESDVTFIEMKGGVVDLDIDVREDHNREWKLILIGLQDTIVRIPDVVYVSGAKVDHETNLVVRKGENQTLNVVCSRDESKTRYSVEAHGAAEDVIKTITIDDSGVSYRADQSGNIKLPVWSWIEKLNTRLDGVDAEFVRVYDAIKDEKETSISWED